MVPTSGGCQFNVQPPVLNLARTVRSPLDRADAPRTRGQRYKPLCTVPKVLEDIEIPTVGLARFLIIHVGHSRCRLDAVTRRNQLRPVCLDSPARLRLFAIENWSRMSLSSVLASNATPSYHKISFVMNDGRDVLPSRGASHVAASANAERVILNTSTVRAPGEPTGAGHIQVPRSPQLLSVHVDGLNAGIHDKNKHGAAYAESSERGSDTSTDGRPPEPHSASTFADSLPSLPASLPNDYDRPTEWDISQSFVENSQSSRTESKLENSQDSLHTLSVNGDGVYELRPLKSEHSSNGSLSPVRSVKDHTSRSGIDTQFAPRHKRTATGDIKPFSAQLVTSHSDEVNGASRRRSKSTGSPAHGSRIAQVYPVVKHTPKYFFNASVVVCSYSDAVVLCGSQD